VIWIKILFIGIGFIAILLGIAFLIVYLENNSEDEDHD